MNTRAMSTTATATMPAVPPAFLVSSPPASFSQPALARKAAGSANGASSYPAGPAGTSATSAGSWAWAGNWNDWRVGMLAGRPAGGWVTRTAGGGVLAVDEAVTSAGLVAVPVPPPPARLAPARAAACRPAAGLAWRAYSPRNGSSASTTSSVLPYRPSGVLAISFLTTSTSPAGASGANSGTGSGSLVWWAIIFSTELPSGNGTRPVRQ